MAQHHSTSASRQLDKGAAKEGKIRAAHLLVKHKDSRRPSSWREAEITRSKEEAIKIIQGHEGRIRAEEITLGDLSMTESDCSSARKKGDLYVFFSLSLSISMGLDNGGNKADLSFCIGDSLDPGRCRRSSKMWLLRLSPVKSAMLLILLREYI